MKNLFCCLFILFFATLATATERELFGEACGRSEIEAKKEALADLASTIKVRVYSKYEQSISVKDGEAKVNSGHFTKLTSNVPLLNPTVDIFRKDDEYCARAYLGDGKVYLQKLSELVGKIDELTISAGSAADFSTRYRILEKTLPLYEEYDGFFIVAITLDIKDIPKPKYSSESITSLLLSMREEVPSLDIAAEVLTGGMSEENIYVYSIRQSGRSEDSSFGNFFREMLAAKIKSVKNKAEADYDLKCSYIITSSNISLSCNLLKGATKLRASFVNIPRALLSATDYQTRSKSVSSILDENLSEQSSLKVGLKISGESDAPFLREGEKFTILVKLNKKAYVYLLAYSDFGVKLFSLGGADDKFYKMVSDTETWVSLGRFSAEKPLGKWTIQIFASQNEPDYSMLPSYLRLQSGLVDIEGEKAVKDVLYFFNKSRFEKSFAYATVTIIKAGANQ